MHGFAIHAAQEVEVVTVIERAVLEVEFGHALPFSLAVS